ncbi:MAG: cell division protein ZapA [Ferruginibacter sp.]|nr:cell division protein ZapA [Ferruginibacter sp.]
MDELIPINIIIADRSYRIRTLPEHEEVIRKTLKQINDKIIEYKTQFAGKDMQDYIAMVVIWFATQASTESTNPEMEKELREQLQKIESLLDGSL